MGTIVKVWIRRTYSLEIPDAAERGGLDAEEYLEELGPDQIAFEGRESEDGPEIEVLSVEEGAGGRKEW